MQLRRVVEIAGMTAYCDFDEQITVGNPNEPRLRPDMVINLAGGKQIIVDSKVPLDAYMKAMNAETEIERNVSLTNHLRQTRTHITNLSSKHYQDQFESTPDMTVMFIPADSTFIAALDQDAELIEWAAQRGVLMASPLTLIAVLKAVAVGWREEQLAENARAISSLGQDLYQRISVFTTRFTALGRRLNSTVTGFNEAAGSLDGRVLPSARRFHELGVIPTEEELKVVDIETTARELRAPEAQSLAGDEEESSS
jgi:DNA recombination protein RmuC